MFIKPDTDGVLQSLGLLVVKARTSLYVNALGTHGESGPIRKPMNALTCISMNAAHTPLNTVKCISLGLSERCHLKASTLPSSIAKLAAWKILLDWNLERLKPPKEVETASKQTNKTLNRS